MVLQCPCPEDHCPVLVGQGCRHLVQVVRVDTDSLYSTLHTVRDVAGGGRGVGWFGHPQVEPHNDQE